MEKHLFFQILSCFFILLLNNDFLNDYYLLKTILGTTDIHQLKTQEKKIASWSLHFNKQTVSNKHNKGAIVYISNELQYTGEY